MGFVFIDADEALITFENNDTSWKTAFPSVLTQNDIGSPIWYPDNTLPYNGASTYRAGAIGHGGTVETVLTIQFVATGSITFNYSGQSEGSCDWFQVYFDNSQKVNVAGYYGWTEYTISNIAPGTHTLKFHYHKDGSVSSGVDTFAVGFIRIKGVATPYDVFYLVQDQDTNKWYKNQAGEFAEVTIAGSEPTLQEFRDNGGDAFTDEMLFFFAHYKLFKCADTEDWQSSEPTLKATMTGNIVPTILKLSPPARMTQPYQTGIDTISMVISHLETTDVRFVVSYDNQSWYAWDSENEVWNSVLYTPEDILSDGMDQMTLESLTAEEFAILYNNVASRNLYIALAISSSALDDWRLKSGSVSFATNL